MDRIRAAGGEVYAITSEPQRLADEAREDWQLTFSTLGDPHHEIIGQCRERDWLDIIVNPKTELLNQASNTDFSHPKGYFQPGVLALDRSGRILYRWRGVPTRSNMGGATERPTASYVSEKVTAALTAADNERAQHAALDSKPELDMRGIPWPVFLTILTANGWFIKPRPFPHTPGGPSVQQRFLRAILRIPLFVGAWILAFSLLPAALVGVALAAWALWLTPHIRYINDQFQNVRPP